MRTPSLEVSAPFSPNRVVFLARGDHRAGRLGAARLLHDEPPGGRGGKCEETARENAACACLGETKGAVPANCEGKCQ